MALCAHIIAFDNNEALLCSMDFTSVYYFTDSLNIHYTSAALSVS